MRGVYADKSKEHKCPKRNKTTRSVVHASVYKYKDKQDEHTSFLVVTLIFRQSFNLSPLLTILLKHASRGRMKHNADNSTVCHTKQKGIESHANNWKIAFVTIILNREIKGSSYPGLPLWVLGLCFLESSF